MYTKKYIPTVLFEPIFTMTAFINNLMCINMSDETNEQLNEMENNKYRYYLQVMKDALTYNDINVFQTLPFDDIEPIYWGERTYFLETFYMKSYKVSIYMIEKYIEKYNTFNFYDLCDMFDTLELMEDLFNEMVNLDKLSLMSNCLTQYYNSCKNMYQYILFINFINYIFQPDNNFKYYKLIVNDVTKIVTVTIRKDIHLDIETQILLSCKNENTPLYQIMTISNKLQSNKRRIHKMTEQEVALLLK